MTLNKNTVLNLSIFFLIYFTSFTQKNYFSIKYGINNGLLSNDNYRVYQDNEGYIWILSEKGIVKYNGYKFTYFTTNQGLKTNDIWDMDIDSKNRKWLRSFSNGVQYIEDDVVKTVKNSDKHGILTYVGEHSDTAFFIQYSSERIEQKRYFFSPNNSFGEYNKSRDSLELVYSQEQFGTKFYRKKGENGISVLTNNKFVPIQQFNYFFSLSSYDLNFFKEKIPLFVRFYKKWCFEYVEDGKLIPFSIASITPQAIIRLYYDVSSKYTIAKTNSMYYVFKNYKTLERDHHLEAILNSEILNGKKIAHILIDRERNLWLVENRGQLLFFPNNGLRFEKLKGKDQVNNVVSPSSPFFFLDRPNSLYKIDSHSTFSKVNIPSVSTIYHYEYYKNKLFVLAGQRLYEYDFANPKKETILYSPSFNTKVFTFLDDNLLLMNNRDIYSLSEKKVISTLELPEGMKKSIVTEKFIISYTEDLLYMIDKADHKTIKKPIRDIQFIKEMKGTLFIVAGKDLYTIRLDNLDSFEKIYTIKDNIGTVSYQNNRLNIITDKQIIFASFDFNTQKISNISYLNTRPYGFQVNDIQWLNSDEVYLFTTDGLYLVSNINSVSNPSIPFKLKTKKSGDIIQLNYPENTLIINLEPMSYSNFGEVVFRYSFENQRSNKKHFIYTNEQQIILNDLSPGKYKLYIESAPDRLGPFKNGKTLYIDILPSFYETTLFKLVFIVIVLGCIFLAIVITRKLMSTRNKRRLRIKELELSALRSQLNPHFVFNVLNSIQGIMMYQSKEKANECIYAFSELIRTVLNNSRQKKVALSEELKLIEHYLYLENMRLDIPFQYIIENKSSIDPESIPIYGMVIQPFVENCVVHAFTKHRENKIIKLTYEVKGAFLYIRIQDNGMGLKKSSMVEKKTHKSWASTILQEKSKLLNSISKQELIIHIFDVEDKMLTGTTVDIIMKINPISL